MCRMTNRLPQKQPGCSKQSGCLLAPKASRTELVPGSHSRKGMTLVELLVASSMLLMLAGVIGGLASAVQTSSGYSQGHAEAAQHARVAIERISRDISRATAVGDYPGFAVVYDDIGGVKYPETLLVWRPTNGTPANASGPPLISELVIYCADPKQPQQLLQIRAPQDSRTIPLDASLNQSPWIETIAAVKTDAQSECVVLTNLLRAATVSGNKAAQRSAVRFVQELQPSADEMTAYRAGTQTWSSLAWPQGMYGTQTGMRQSWLRLELQLMPGTESRTDATGQQAAPFLGSAALSYQLRP